jgi:hypothetical protein
MWRKNRSEPGEVVISFEISVSGWHALDIIRSRSSHFTAASARETFFELQLAAIIKAGKKLGRN